MRRIHCTVVAAALALAGCAGHGPDAQYQRLAKTYAQAPGLHSEATLTLTRMAGEPGDSPQRLNLVTDAARPNKLRVDARMADGAFDTTVVSDGQFVWQQVATREGPTVLKAPAPAHLKDLLNERGPVVPGALNGPPVVYELQLFAGAAPRAKDLHLAPGPARAELAGVQCDTLDAKPEGSPPYRLYVGLADRLLHGMALRLESQRGEVRIDWTAPKVSLGAAPAAERFVFKPIARERVVEAPTIAEAMDVMPLHLGQPAPAFNLPTLQADRQVSLQSLRGKPVVIDFWATWCGPCKQQQEVLKQFYAQYKDRATFLMVTSEEASDALPVVKERALAMTQLRDPGGKVTKQFGVEPIPCTVFLDAQGVRRAAIVGFRPNETVDRYVKALTPLLTAK